MTQSEGSEVTKDEVHSKDHVPPFGGTNCKEHGGRATWSKVLPVYLSELVQKIGSN